MTDHRKMRLRSIALACVPFPLLVVLLPACGGDDDGGGDGGSAAASQDPSALEGKSWILTQYLGVDGSTQIVNEGVNAEFDGSTISGKSGCNSYNGPYTATGNEISIGNLASTQMACAEDVMAVEARYLQLLGEAATWEISGRSMSMAGADGTPTLQFMQG
jgi:heat shock protein HslJ